MFGLVRVADFLGVWPDVVALFIPGGGHWTARCGTRSRDMNMLAAVPARHATEQVPNANTQAASCEVPPKKSSVMPNRSVPTKPPAKPMQEYTATVAPSRLGSATASNPDVRLEKLPCTMKPAATARTTTTP